MNTANSNSAGASIKYEASQAPRFAPRGLEDRRVLVTNSVPFCLGLAAVVLELNRAQGTYDGSFGSLIGRIDLY